MYKGVALLKRLLHHITTNSIYLALTGAWSRGMISPSHGEGRGFNSHSVQCFALFCLGGVDICNFISPGCA